MTNEETIYFVEKKRMGGRFNDESEAKKCERYLKRHGYIVTIKTIKMRGNKTVFNVQGISRNEKQRHRFDRRKWVPDHIWSKLMTAVNDGMSRKDFQNIVGSAKVCMTVIEEEEDPKIKEVLSKEFPSTLWFMYPRISASDILERERQLKGLSPNLVKRKIPLSKFLEGEDYEEDTKGINVSPKVMRRIVRFFLDNQGRYVCIQKGKTERGRDEIYVIGEIAKSKKPRSDLILLDRYHYRQRKWGT